jgi:hypothetical protein
MSAKRSRPNESDQQHGASGGRKWELKTHKKTEKQTARLLAEAQEGADKVKEDAANIEILRQDVERKRAALEEEKTAMKTAHIFQKSKILLDVGGHKFTTSRLTLTSIPDTYLASLFSGRFELTSDPEGAYFIDRDGRHFHHILNFLRDSESVELSTDLSWGQRKELAIELKFYGLLGNVLPYYEHERVGQSLLRRACLTGEQFELEKAVAQAHALVFEIGSTTRFLKDEFQNLQFVITDRVVNESPVWAAVGGKWFMYRNITRTMHIGEESDSIEGCTLGCLFNRSNKYLSPTDLPWRAWLSTDISTQESLYESAERLAERECPGCPLAIVPDLRVNVVHRPDDNDPALVAALRLLAEFA